MPFPFFTYFILYCSFKKGAVWYFHIFYKFYLVDSKKKESCELKKLKHRCCRIVPMFRRWLNGARYVRTILGGEKGWCLNEKRERNAKLKRRRAAAEVRMLSTWKGSAFSFLFYSSRVFISLRSSFFSISFSLKSDIHHSGVPQTIYLEYQWHGNR